MKQLPLEKREVLRYLGYKRRHELTPELEQMVERAIVEVQKVSNARYHYQLFDLKETAQGIEVTGTDLLFTGQDIHRHLAQAQRGAILAVTLGTEVEQVIRRYEVTDLTYALVMEAACTEYIEKLCDLVEAKIAQTADQAGFTANRRFSPGYGDLPLSIQPGFVATLQQERNLGITVTAEFLMIPRKSVTAIMGLFAEESQAKPRRKQPAWCTEYLSQGGV